MDALTPEQQKKLEALLAALGESPIGETIVHCLEAVGIDPSNEADQKRADAAMAGAWAFDRVLLYLIRLRSLNEERMNLGVKIRQNKEHPYPRSEEEIEAAAKAWVMAPHLAGQQEVVLNFFAVSVQHIRSLLMVAAAAVGYVIPQDDLDFLDQFRYLRNHFEHWYDRLPGKAKELGLVTKTITADGYQVRGGLESDEKDRVIVVEPKKLVAAVHIVEANNEGVTRVERIVEETYEGVKALALEQVRLHFTTHPDDIPPPESVRNDLLLKVGSPNLGRH